MFWWGEAVKPRDIDPVDVMKKGAWVVIALLLGGTALMCFADSFLCAQRESNTNCGLMFDGGDVHDVCSCERFIWESPD